MRIVVMKGVAAAVAVRPGSPRRHRRTPPVASPVKLVLRAQLGKSNGGDGMGLKQCPVNSTHQYPGHLSACPHCARTRVAPQPRCNEPQAIRRQANRRRDSRGRNCSHRSRPGQDYRSCGWCRAGLGCGCGRDCRARSTYSGRPDADSNGDVLAAFSADSDPVANPGIIVYTHSDASDGVSASRRHALDLVQ